MKHHIDDFIKKLNQEQYYSLHTILNYKRDLEKWLFFYQKNHINQWKEVQHKEIKHFLMQQKNKQISAVSMRRYLSSLRLFFDYLVMQKILTKNPAKQIKSPKIAQKLSKVLSAEEIQTLINLKSLTTRDSLIIELFYVTGIRLSELVNINISHIDQSGFVKILGKGNKERYAPIGKRTLKKIKQYIKSRIDEENALFINNKQMRISTRSIQNILKNAILKSDIDRHLHPHMLRHSAASHFLQSSENLRIVQNFLGHQNISSTQRYTHLDYQHIAKVYDKTHPRK